MDSEREARLRREAMAWLTVRTQDGSRPISREEVGDFTFDGAPFRLIPPQQGIWKPAVLAAALTIVTNEGSPYADGVGPDGLPRYNWQGRDPQHADNRALRAAMQLQSPLIWLFGVGRAFYQPVYPVYLLREEPAEHRFVVVHEAFREVAPYASPIEAELRRYILRETKRRLHQPLFRATVLRAYEQRCAVCSLGHAQLLDAAHIVADSAEDGQPVVSNGLSLCKIHHAAYDAHILGIRPDLVVQIRTDILAEVDGPMLRYGLQGRHDQPLMSLPRARAERPGKDRLAVAYAAFRDAPTPKGQR